MRAAPRHILTGEGRHPDPYGPPVAAPRPVWYAVRMGREFLTVDPRGLRLPPTRIAGADPAKLQRQIARHGRSLAGMPPVLVYRGSDGELMIMNGVTRATRAAKLCPGVPIPVEVMGNLPGAFGSLPTVAEKLP